MIGVLATHGMLNDLKAEIPIETIQHSTQSVLQLADLEITRRRLLNL